MEKPKPLTEKDIVNTPIGLSILPFVWVKDVQSAKRLAHYKFNRELPANMAKLASRILDACFQIDDNEEVK
jgi:hypothetical protein